MIKTEKRRAVQALSAAGKRNKEIARLLGLDARTVRKILACPADVKAKPRSDKKTVDIELLRDLYARCDGYLQRVHEILEEEYDIKTGYSTLTRLVRAQGIGQKGTKRCHHVDDIPGAEMQHDTTLYKIKIGDSIMKLICSGLYLRYSKMRYIKFYPYFNRFLMKCFIYEALSYWGYAAGTCVIDNTSLAIDNGTGKNAVFSPQMQSFAKPYGFQWLAHEKGHANRKAGKERNFWTVETNFLPGRKFESIEDLNHQAFEWSTNRYARRPQSKTRLIPVMLFEQEKPDLIKLPGYIEPPSLPLKRSMDRYGYIAFDANYYWIPGKTLTKNITVIQYPDYIAIYPPEKPVIEYPLPPWGTRNETFKPDGADTNPYKPNNIKKSCHEEESRLKALGQIYCDYLDFIKSKDSDVKQKPKFIRDLYGLSKKTAPGLLTKTIERALNYRVANIQTLVRISGQLMENHLYSSPQFAINNDYEQRPVYQQGRFCEEADTNYYQDLFEEKDDNHNKDQEQIS